MLTLTHVRACEWNSRVARVSRWQPGEEKGWEDWEWSYKPLMTSAFIIYGIAFAYR